MAAEAALSERMGLAPARDVARLGALLARFGLPTSLPAGVTLAEMAALTARDKKARSGAVHYTLLRRIGSARVGVPITTSTLRTHWPL
jgi:3-dehydroquinate synthase